jgi:hypothetical protein
MVYRQLGAPLAETYIFSDIDGTIFEVSERFSQSTDPGVRDQLLNVIPDALNLAIVTEISQALRASAKLILLTGRRRSHATHQQFQQFLPAWSYEFIRNSTLYNPSLSSVHLKRMYFDALLSIASVDHAKSLPTRFAIFYDDREDVMTAVTNVFKSRNWNYHLTMLGNIHKLNFCF